MHSRGGVAAALLQLAALGPVSAGVGVWTTNGPAEVRAVVVDPASPRTVYASGREKVFRSDDGGGTWIQSIKTIAGPILSLAVDPSSREILYAGIMPVCPGNFGSVVLKSFDAGRHWFETQPGIRCLSPQVIVPDPLDPQTLFVGTGPTIRNTSVGVYRSDDGGLNWSLVGSPGCPVVVDLSVEPDRLLAATGGCGLSESLDLGVTWRFINDGLPPGAAQTVQTVARVPLGPFHWVIGTSAGVFRTTNGQTWTATSVRASTTDLVADRARPGRVFAATFDQGVLRSDDGGSSWAPFNEGLTVAEIRSLALDPSGRVLYAGTPAGVFQHEFPPCEPTAEGNCLGLRSGRFRVSLSAEDPRTHRTGEGRASKQTEEFGWFSFPLFTGSEANPEVFVKILDGRSVTGHFWVFHAGLTDLGYVLSVTDTETGEARNYRKEAGTACGGFETSHF